MCKTMTMCKTASCSKARCMVHKQRPAAREDVAGGLDHTTEGWCTLAHSWHTVGAPLARANSGLGARQLVSSRAPSPELARANSRVGAPTSHLARANSPVGARQIRSWRANLPLGARQNHAKPVPAHFVDRLLP